MCTPEMPLRSASSAAAVASMVSLASRPGPGRTSSRGPGTGVNGTAICIFG
jgi:hypothetical protein